MNTVVILSNNSCPYQIKIPNEKFIGICKLQNEPVACPKNFTTCTMFVCPN